MASSKTLTQMGILSARSNMLFLGLCISLMAVVREVDARDIQIDNLIHLRQALLTAREGDRFSLAEGDYGEFGLWPDGPFDSHRIRHITIRSADPKSPAIFTRLNLHHAYKITFEDLVFEFNASSTAPEFVKPFKILDSEAITIRKSHFIGKNDNRFGVGHGLFIGSSTSLLIESNFFHNFFRGIAVGASDEVIIRENEISGMRSDGLNFVGVVGLVIEKNELHSFRRKPESGDHADMIQFWTMNAKRPTKDVIIRNNILNMGSGDHTQSIFMRNEAVDSQSGGLAMYYRNILIEENVILNAHLHGITVGESEGLVIRNNTLIRVPRRGLPRGDRGNENWVPRIGVNPRSINVTIINNIAPTIPITSNSWDVSGNFSIQDLSLMNSGHYSRVFVQSLSDAPYSLSNFYYRLDGPVPRSGLGASILSVHK